MSVMPVRFGLALLVIAALAAAMSVAVSWHLTSALAAWDEEHIAAIVRSELAEGDALSLFHAAPQTPAIHERWREVLKDVVEHIPGVVRCKVWSGAGTVLWSDDAALIGTRAGDNADLRVALSGRVVVRLVEPDRDDTDAAWRSQMLTRIYVPVGTVRDDHAEGVIELRKEPTQLTTHLTAALAAVWAIGGIGALALWLVFRPVGRVRAVPARAPTRVRSPDEILAEIRARIGFLPPFFEPAIQTPVVLENLWQQTISAYIENPLPALLKEKLFAYLSRYCAVPYCIVCHSCALRPLGMTAPDVLRLLDSRPRREEEITLGLTTLAAEPAPLLSWPAPGTALETALFDCAIFAFVHAERAEQCERELRRLLGADYSRLAEFLAYVRACHAWVELHPELSYAADERARVHLAPLLEAEPRLDEFFRDYHAHVLREREAAEAVRLAELAARAPQAGRASGARGASGTTSSS